MAAFLSAHMPGKPTLALRAGGRRVWGSFPYFESAFLGGPSTLAGYRSARFADDASLYGGAQVRLTMGRAFLGLPAVSGVFGEADVGRVYVDGESPGGWHSAGGAGVWLAYLGRENAVSLGVNSSKEGTLVQGGVAFGF